MAGENYIAKQDTLLAVQTNIGDVIDSVGNTNDTGGTATAGTSMAKLNRIITDVINIPTIDTAKIDSIYSELMIPKFTKAIIASGSFTIPKDGTYKIIACGAGGKSAVGGGGCAIDQRDYVEGDTLIVTVSGSSSAICSARGLSMTANGTTTATGAKASGGNVANYTGGTSADSGRDSDGCGASGYSTTYITGGNGGIIGGDGYTGTNTTTGGTGGNGGNGGIMGGNGGVGGASNSSSGTGGTGGTGIFGGTGGAGGKGGSSSGEKGAGGIGGIGIIKGGDGGTCGSVGANGNAGGAGGNGGILGGNGGTGTTMGGNGGNAGFLKGEIATTTAGGKGAFTGMPWAIPFIEVFNWTKGNAIIFIEEV